MPRVPQVQEAPVYEGCSEVAPAPPDGSLSPALADTRESEIGAQPAEIATIQEPFQGEVDRHQVSSSKTGAVLATAACTPTRKRPSSSLWLVADMSPAPRREANVSRVQDSGGPGGAGSLLKRPRTVVQPRTSIRDPSMAALWQTMRPNMQPKATVGTCSVDNPTGSDGTGPPPWWVPGLSRAVERRPVKRVRNTTGLPSEDGQLVEIRKPSPQGRPRKIAATCQRKAAGSCQGRTATGAPCRSTGTIRPERARFAYCRVHASKWARFEPVGFEQLPERPTRPSIGATFPVAEGPARCTSATSSKQIQGTTVPVEARVATLVESAAAELQRGLAEQARAPSKPAQKGRSSNGRGRQPQQPQARSDQHSRPMSSSQTSVPASRRLGLRAAAGFEEMEEVRKPCFAPLTVKNSVPTAHEARRPGSLDAGVIAGLAEVLCLLPQ